MTAQAEVTAATWRPQLSAASYPQSGSTITSSYPGSTEVHPQCYPLPDLQWCPTLCQSSTTGDQQIA